MVLKFAVAPQEPISGTGQTCSSISSNAGTERKTREISAQAVPESDGVFTATLRERSGRYPCVSFVVSSGVKEYSVNLQVKSAGKLLPVGGTISLYAS